MPDKTATIMLATELTTAWLSNPHTRASAEEVPGFLTAMVAAVAGLGELPAPGGATQEAKAEHKPAVSARRSLADPDHIVSMIDGKPYRSLKRHLTAHGLTPESYRERFNLRHDYPMVAPGYSEARRATALRLGLGRTPGKRAAALAEDAPAGKPASRGRKSIAAARQAAREHLGGK